MDVLLTYVLILLSGISGVAQGLHGPHVCSEQQNITLTTRVKYQQPVSVRTYRWCFDIPPKCSSVHIEMRDKWKVQTEVKTKTIYFCCPGFAEEEEKCLPRCRDGLTGDKCDEDCPPGQWGPSCSHDCRCPKNSLCDPKNGKCVCIDGWIGSSCDIPRLSLVPITVATSTKETKPLFDWNSRIPTSTSTLTTISTAAPTVSKDVVLLTTSKPTTQINNITTTTTTIMPSAPTTTQRVTEITTTSTTKPKPTEDTKKDQTISQIESPLPTIKTSSPSMTDSPITVILHNASKIPIKIIPKPTESSIISLTVLKSTAISLKKKVIYKVPKSSKQGDSDLIKITLHSPQRATPTRGSKDGITTAGSIHSRNSTKIDGVMNFEQSPIITVSPLDNNTFFTMITTDVQTEEIKHVLTEPEQITSVAEDSGSDESRDSLYSAIIVCMGVVLSLIFVATVIVFVTKYRRSYYERCNKMEMERVQAMMNATEDELPSSYLRSVFHSPLPDVHVETTRLGINNHKTITYVNPVVIHTISPILMESFKEVLESHYDHPKPPRPASVTLSTVDHQKNYTFGTLPSSFRPQNSFLRQSEEVSFPVTGEAINALKLECSKTLTLEMENLDPIYDEIPWRPNTAQAKEVVDDCDEAVTEL